MKNLFFIVVLSASLVLVGCKNRRNVDVTPPDRVECAEILNDQIVIDVSLATSMLLSSYDSFDEFVDPAEEGTQKIAFTTNIAVREFNFISIGVNIEPFGFYEDAVLHTVDVLLVGKPFVVNWMEWGTFPHRGISYLDENDVRRYFVLNMNNAEAEEDPRGDYLLIEFNFGD